MHNYVLYLFYLLLYIVFRMIVNENETETGHIKLSFKFSKVKRSLAADTVQFEIQNFCNFRKLKIQYSKSDSLKNFSTLE